VSRQIKGIDADSTKAKAGSNPKRSSTIIDDETVTDAVEALVLSQTFSLDDNDTKYVLQKRVRNDSFWLKRNG